MRATLAQRVTFALVPGQRIEPLITQRPKGGGKVVFRRREDSASAIPVHWAMFHCVQGVSAIVKYKHLPAMAHNFAHSFVNGMNYVDGTFVVDEIRRILRTLGEVELVIDFLHGQIQPATVQSPILMKSVGFYQSWLPEHAAHHRVELARVHQLNMRFSGPGKHFACVVVVADDRGVTHTIRLKAWWK